MTLTQFLCPVILFTFAHAFGAEKQVPLACNLKAFTAEEKVAWRNLIDEVRRAESPINELSNGYVFRIDITKVSITRLAEWVDLERKCCPFLDFQVSLHGANGDLSLALTGRQGVKEFISEDFRPWFETR